MLNDRLRMENIPNVKIFNTIILSYPVHFTFVYQMIRHSDDCCRNYVILKTVSINFKFLFYSWKRCCYECSFYAILKINQIERVQFIGESKYHARIRLSYGTLLCMVEQV